MKCLRNEVLVTMIIWVIHVAMSFEWKLLESVELHDARYPKYGSCVSHGTSDAPASPVLISKVALPSSFQHSSFLSCPTTSDNLAMEKGESGAQILQNKL